MNNNLQHHSRSVFWLNKLSVLSLWCIVRQGITENILIRFIECTRVGWFVFLFLKFLGIIKAEAVKAEYSMGDMRSTIGESLQYEAYRVSSETTAVLVKKLKGLSVYQRLTSLLPQGKVDLYLEKLIYYKIFPIVRLLCIIRWYICNKQGGNRHVIVYPKTDFFSDLKDIWPDEMVLLIGYKPLSLPSLIRLYIKKLYNLGQDIFASILPKSLRPDTPNNEPCVAVHYVEGIDLNRRSDLFWYPDSQINPERVLIYFDRSYNHPIAREHIKQIESMGMRWTSLCWRWDIPCSLKSVWRPPLRRKILLNAFKSGTVYEAKSSMTGKWLFNAGVDLLRDVEYWQAFYKAFNVKIHHDPLEGWLQNVVQNIALGLDGGLRVGKQRSELFIPISAMRGYYPDHIFFSWNCRTPTYLQVDRNRNDYCIVSGFPYDAVFAGKKKEDGDYLRKRLKDNGARFVIALYDNMFSKDSYHSKTMMKSFYTNFLEWMLEDGEIGLIIKSKKPHVLDCLPEIHDLLTCAKATGRCMQLDNIVGRLASDAAHGADVAVGIGGISSALVEAVIAGCRGVICELTGLRSHPFYQWGYGKVIFDDVGSMLKTLKRFKEKPDYEPKLGDWVTFIDKLDPFRDGKGGERIGTYIRWLLEGFNSGMSGDIAVQYANKFYADKWGKDKVIDLNEVEQCAPIF